MDIMKVKSVEEITPEVIEFINGILTKKKSLEYIIKTYSKSINVEDAVVVEQAKNEFLKFIFCFWKVKISYLQSIWYILINLIGELYG